MKDPKYIYRCVMNKDGIIVEEVILGIVVDLTTEVF